MSLTEKRMTPLLSGLAWFAAATTRTSNDPSKVSEEDG